MEFLKCRDVRWKGPVSHFGENPQQSQFCLNSLVTSLVRSNNCAQPMAAFQKISFLLIQVSYEVWPYPINKVNVHRTCTCKSFRRTCKFGNRLGSDYFGSREVTWEVRAVCFTVVFERPRKMSTLNELFEQIIQSEDRIRKRFTKLRKG